MDCVAFGTPVPGSPSAVTVSTPSTHGHFALYTFAAYGDLRRLVMNTGALSQPLARYYFLQLVSAVQQCHSKAVCHCDIKLDNCLLNHFMNTMLGDFGLAQFAVTGAGRPPFVDPTGTLPYMAPEVAARLPVALLRRRGYMHDGVRLGAPPELEAAPSHVDAYDGFKADIVRSSQSSSSSLRCFLYRG